ncbi:MAG: transglutaminase-like domain-containing protein [Candidatus Woesearchaeota archaeon]
MKKLILFILLISIIPLTSAQIENYNDYTELTIDYSLNTDLVLIGSSMNFLEAELFLIPLNNNRQEVQQLNINSNPTANINQDSDKITYRWTNYNPTLSFGYNSRIKTKNILYPVSKSSFPILSVPSENEQYLQAGETIDITPAIVNKAAEIIEGETDLYTVVFKLADWTKTNINYDLNTLTAEAAQKSSWVLNNKEGVCDEITSLFISFLRSIGIPARFVSGSVYSNINYRFENHGWAEVYFPGQGWIPYDVTFGQYGWVDPSHLELSKTLDSKVSSVKYRWESTKLDIESNPLEREIVIKNQGSKIDPIFDIDLEILKNEVGPGSYIPFRAKVSNPYDKYLSDSLHVTKAPAALNQNQQQVLLKPSQENSVFWIVQVPNDLLPNRIYTSKIEVKDLFESSDEKDLQFADSFEVFTEEEALDLIEKLQEKEEKSYSEELSLNCGPSKSYYYLFEQPEITCNLQNIGNTLLNNVNLCINSQCQSTELKIAEKQEIKFQITQEQAKNELIATATFNDKTLQSYVNIKILEKPDLVITGLDYPQEVNFGEDFIMSFILTSEAEVQDVSIEINNLDHIMIEKQERAEEIRIETSSKYFISNIIDIKVKYKDEYGSPFEVTQQAQIKILNTPWYEKILNFFRNLF